MSNDHRFEQVPQYSKDDLRNALASRDSNELSKIVISEALYGSDLSSAEDLCVQLAGNTDPIVRGNAILGFGHLARRFRTLNNADSRSLIESGLEDESDYVRGQAWAAADDVNNFLGWTIRGFSMDD